jgi:hypothetical protein
MRKTDLAWACVAVLATAALARACFFEASWQLLGDRPATLRQAPANSFAWEAARLAPASPWFHPHAPAPGVTGGPSARDAAERAGLTPAQLSALAAMRAAPDSRWALSAAGALPEALRLYTGGAIAFQHGNLADAREYFSYVLALPPERAAPRAVWAQYMLGRVALGAGHPDEAEAAFAAVRDRVAHGAPDPLDLGVASLGEQARLVLARGDVAGAVALYAEQAADGSAEAVQSLRLVAEGVMKTPDRLPALVKQPLVQRLLVVHALGLTGDYLHQLWIGGTAYSIEVDGFWPPDGLDTRPLAALLAAVRGSGVVVAGSDRLAALAYRLGDEQAAAALAGATRSPLALWVRAKLALAWGARGEAPALFAAALRAAEAAQPAAAVEPSSAGLLRGETAVETLSRGDFVQAASIMWPVARTYWGDFAYLAERVLTTDELVAFVSAHAPEPKAGTDAGADPVNAIRSLLARRLMRDGRTEDALRYFDPVTIGGSTASEGDVRADAAAYAAASARARTAFWAIDRARAAWAAAVLLRLRGMEMMGTEEAPDQAYIQGERAYFLGPARPLAASEDDVTPGERIRVEASRPRPDLRFHYRYLALDQAMAAAGDLPPRSQAYAAVLCRAAGWSLGLHDTDRTRAIWRRYAATGARVAFATHFGRFCPAPDFDGVWRTRAVLARDAAHDTLHHALPGRRTKLMAASGAAAVLAAVFILDRARRRGPPPSPSPAPPEPPAG